ncbi:hypothetical protein KCV06_g412, partial [Aureobasidium melanogenum]
LLSLSVLPQLLHPSAVRPVPRRSSLQWLRVRAGATGETFTIDRIETLLAAMARPEDRDVEIVLGQLVGRKTDGGRRMIKRDTAKDKENRYQNRKSIVQREKREYNDVEVSNQKLGPTGAQALRSTTLWAVRQSSMTKLSCPRLTIHLNMFLGSVKQLGEAGQPEEDMSSSNYR